MTRKSASVTEIGSAGERLRVAITAKYELRADELVILDQACAVLDVIGRLDAELVDAPLVVAGSVGQLREHPLLSESRQSRAALARLLGQLGLPDEGAGSSSRSNAGRQLARRRWST
jgi:hypothetical protein